MRVSVIILTLGDRPDELAAAIDSARGQRNVEAEIVVVGNGAPVEADGVVIDALEENIGVSAGRNHGAHLAGADLLMFLDDDAVLANRDVCSGAAAMFEDDPSLAVISCRIVDPETGLSQRRHIPRPGRADPFEAGEVTTFLGGASFVRAEPFLRAGGFPDSFFYAHEETDLAWRLIENGWSIRYAPDLVVHHPATLPSRHDQAARLSMRNRVFLARRNLPWPLVPFYIFNWTVISLIRARTWDVMQATLAGIGEGLAGKVERDAMSWATVRRLSRLGRPPVF